jgi:opacity protein-like surface antigen
MRSLLVTGVVFALAAGGAMAQVPPAQNGPQNSAINRSDSTNRQVTAPVQGHNSFTEGEAKSRIEKRGFTNVGQLTKDADGVWRGQAMKDGNRVDVSVDYQGNVVVGTGAGTTGVPVRGAAGR